VSPPGDSETRPGRRKSYTATVSVGFFPVYPATRTLSRRAWRPFTGGPSAYRDTPLSLSAVALSPAAGHRGHRDRAYWALRPFGGPSAYGRLFQSAGRLSTRRSVYKGPLENRAPSRLSPLSTTGRVVTSESIEETTFALAPDGPVSDSEAGHQRPSGIEAEPQASLESFANKGETHPRRRPSKTRGLSDYSEPVSDGLLHCLVSPTAFGFGGRPTTFASKQPGFGLEAVAERRPAVA
jgi:hypothetical protein